MLTLNKRMDECKPLALGSAYGAALVPLALAGAPVAPPQAYALVGMAGVLAGRGLHSSTFQHNPSRTSH